MECRSLGIRAIRDDRGPFIFSSQKGIIVGAFSGSKRGRVREITAEKCLGCTTLNCIVDEEATRSEWGNCKALSMWNAAMWVLQSWRINLKTTSSKGTGR